MPQKHKDAIEIFMERFLMVRRLGGIRARKVDSVHRTRRD
jgi:hypothetical protein